MGKKSLVMLVVSALFVIIFGAVHFFEEQKVQEKESTSSVQGPLPASREVNLPIKGGVIGSSPFQEMPESLPSESRPALETEESVCVVKGQVIGADGKGINAATVTFDNPDPRGRGYQRTCLLSTTDQSGNFSFNSEVGSFGLTIHAELEAGDYAYREMMVVVPKTGRDLGEIRLPELNSTRIYGLVTFRDMEGVRVENLSVSLHLIAVDHSSQFIPVKTNEQGGFSVSTYGIPSRCKYKLAVGEISAARYCKVTSSPPIHDVDSDGGEANFELTVAFAIRDIQLINEGSDPFESPRQIVVTNLPALNPSNSVVQRKREIKKATTIPVGASVLPLNQPLWLGEGSLHKLEIYTLDEKRIDVDLIPNESGGLVARINPNSATKQFRVFGVLRDHDRQILTNATFSCQLLDDQGRILNSSTVTTDETGAFSILGLLHNRQYRITYRKPKIIGEEKSTPRPKLAEEFRTGLVGENQQDLGDLYLSKVEGK